MPDDLPDLTPAETERVRRLLAEARHTEPVPDDVAARLDRTLASLAQERREGADAAVVTLASRRRRRRATGLLVAAVAVVVLGVGTGQVLSGQGADDAGGGESLSTADEGSAPGSAAPPQADASRSGLPRVGESTFDADVAALRERRTAAEADGGVAAGACDRPAWGEGRRVEVRYAGQRAVLVFRPSTGSVQAVDLFACGADVPLRSTTVPAP